MLKNAVIFVGFSYLCYIISEYRAWLDIDRVIYNRYPGQCKIILKGKVWLDIDRVIYNRYPGQCKIILKDGGSEDIVELDDDTMLFSSGLHKYGEPGFIYAMYTNGTIQEARLQNMKDDNPLIAPHGLSIWKDTNTGKSLLYVVIHREKEGVCVFEVNKSPLTLTFVRLITDDTFFGFMNDLAVIDKDKFYITQSVRWRSLTTWIIESIVPLPTGKLVYYDGTKGRVVMSGFKMTNGIALSNDKRHLYVAETLTHSVHSLTIQKDGGVKSNWVYNIRTGPDNLHTDSKTGDIWIGACPKLITGVDLYGLFGYQPVGQVIRLKMTNNNVTGIEEVFTDDGEMAAGSSVAVYKNKKLFIGTIKKQLVMCDVHYLM